MWYARSRHLRLWIAALYIVAAAGATFLHAHAHHPASPDTHNAVYAACQDDLVSPTGGPCPACFFLTLNLTDRGCEASLSFGVEVCGRTVASELSPYTSSAPRADCGRAPPTLPVQHS